MNVQFIITMHKLVKQISLTVLLFSFFLLNQVKSQIPYPGENPGEARINTASVNRIILENNAILMEFYYDDQNIRIARFLDVAGNYRLQTDPLPLFELMLKNGQYITSEDFSLTGQPDIKYITGDPASTSF